jgi:hypothetical protein
MCTVSGSPPKHAPFPPDWISKPLRAMVPDELVDLRAALCRESPPDGPLLRAVDGQLARHAAARFAASPHASSHAAALPAPGGDHAARPDDESDDWAWATDS